MKDIKINKKLAIVILCLVFNEIKLAESRCNSQQYTCEDGTCIGLEQVCNRQYDCRNGEDEENCPASCKEDEFSCKDGKCIDESEKCDGKDDCSDGSDEEDCDEECDDFKCPTGECGRRCDDYIDCPDGTDEAGCRACESHEFTCASGDCIHESLRCNEENDCPHDRSDEEGCAGCAEGEFDCGHGQCIANSFVCDHFPDCADNRDEQNCTCDLTTNFDCGNNFCIPRALLCNGIPDCADERDESREQCKSVLTCAPSEHTCGDGTCLPQSNICDGTSQCSDGSDESQCGCKYDEFICANGECIPKYLQCNGYRECSDGSDEINCPTPPPTPPPEPSVLHCPAGQQLCDSGDQCFPRERTCDGYPDCRDRSDESRCHPPVTPPSPYPPQLNLRTYPNAQDIKESSYKLGREVVFQCRDEGPLRAAVRWSRGNNLPLPPGSRDNLGRLEMPNIQLDHSGPYVCSARGFPASTPGAQVTVHLNVQPHVVLTARPPTACQLNEATCANGDCIPKNLVCNGKFDCSDGSDETRCSPHGCEPNEFRCANKRCVLKTWVCDSDDDCGDGSDEIDCGTSPPGSPCSNKQFRCHSGNQCIPKSFHCDSENDCVDRSDEIGCSPVTILRPPPPLIELQATSIFEITCTAVGVPTPEIVWRLNWGHIPEKCKTTSVNGTGVLTCPDIQVEDSGAYSCEAINIRGSVLAVPDTILVVIEPQVVCPRGQFNDEAKSTDDCIPCFCFGVTDRCKSADLYTYQLQPPFDAHKIVGVNISPSGHVDIKDTGSVSRIRTTPTASRFGIEAYQPQTDTGSPYIPYFVMPENYNSNQLKSYGGYLKYKVRYRGYGAPLTFAPDVIISGNGYTLQHHGKQIQPDQSEQVTVRFFAGDWIKRTDIGVEQPATREEIMMALAAVDNILIKLQYVQGEIDTTLDSVEMDSAAARNTGLGLAVYVEECSCPIGYTGYSCESCAPGYVRHRSGPWLGQCYKEERCPHGTYGDPSRGIPCRTCPCPHTSPPNQFTQTCSLGPDGNAICNCPPGYRGNRCEECDSGYTGNPLITGDYCRPIVDTCDPRGSSSPSRDPYGQCQCKELTYGRNCDQCKSNTFHLSGDNLFGCIACFCMGVTETCKSSDYYRDTITTVFASSKQDFKIVTAEDLDNPTDQGIRLDTSTREIVYNNFTFRSPDVKYWSLPSRFLGDKVTSYGGNLRYTVRYTPTPGGSSSRNTAPDVELISRNHIRLSYYRLSPLEPNSAQTVTVPLLEQFWQRNDGQQADREHLLMALADVQAILIKATYTTNSQEVALSSVSLDTAEARNTGNPLRAYEVEQCDCPPGYVGLSCQDCDYGYKRASGGLYLGLCTKCDCNGWSNECDAETGICINCNGHRTGQYCEQCIKGYELNALNQCVASDTGCLCDARGSIGPTCYEGFCRCKSNVVGQTCNRCRAGTFGLNANLTEGCQSCFCSGVSTECSESNMYIEQIPSEIYSDEHDFLLTDLYSRKRISQGFQTQTALNEIGYYFRPSESERLFWSLPRRFTGHRITSYGGKLEFTQRFTQRVSAHYSLDQDIIISGNGITIYWINQKQQQPDIANRISVVLSPASNWQRQDSRQGPRPASREDIMRVLANVDSILIRAQLSSDTSSSFISDITLDTAVTTRTPYKAVNVEVCRCPPGYRGTSCEQCDAGYYRDINDILIGPFGSCTRCPCSGRESSCELSDNRVVCNCLPGFAGYDCSQVGEGPTDRPTEQPPGHLTIIVEIKEPALQIVQAGKDVEFHCEARSTTSNAVRIFWTKDGGPLPDRAIDDHQGLLVITDVRISDSGRYICEASDSISIVTQHITLTVGGNPPVHPQATIYPSYVSIYEGESFNLTCDATGNPSPDVHWERHDRYPFNPQHSIVNGQLRIEHATAADAGRYICTATNSAGSTSAYVDVSVNRPTEVIEPVITPQYFSGETGTTFTLTCETKADYTSIRWEKQNGYLPYNHRSVNGILTVTDARQEDSGTYICIAIDSSGQRGNKTARVTITEAYPTDYPTVRITPKNQTVGQGSTVELYCDATGSPPPTIKWTRVHEDFGPNTHQYGSVLRIQPVDVGDRGIYVCVVNNVNGIAQDSAVLIVERRERPEVDIYPDVTQTVNEGAEVQIICRITAGIPQPTLTWTRRDGRPISSHIYQGSDEIRIQGVRQEDDGEYICTATNELGSASASTTVVVTIPPRITLSHSSPYIVRQGEYVRLECRAEGLPLPTVVWHTHEREFRGSFGRSQTSSAVLEISSAQISDEGVYTCQATNTGGSRQEYLQLQVDSYPTRGDITGEDSGSDKDNYPSRPDVKDNEHPPNVLDEVMTAPVGTRAELRCRVGGHSEQTPIQTQWIRQNNVSLPRNAQTYDSTLYIDNVQPSDGGKYVCLGLDNYGIVRFTVTINLVISTPPRVTLVPSRQVVRPYDNAVVQCQASGDQPIDIQWHAVGRDMPSSVRVDRGYLEFRGIQVADAGKYRCTARNSAGKADSVAEVLVDADKVPPPPPPPVAPELTISASSPEARYGDYLDLQCRSNEHGVILTWSKVNDRLADNVQSQAGYLRFNSLRADNNGIYRCETRGPGGYYHKDYVIDVIETVQQEPTAAPLDIQYAPQGESIYMECRTDLEEPVTYEWSKQNGELPQNVNAYAKQLRINDLTSDDAGTYVCSASNGRQKVETPTVLIVTGIVPYFTQAPNSYIALPTIPDHYARLNFEISFKPESDYGLILYNGNKRKDFISLAMSGGYVEFKFNLGHNTTTLVSPEPVQIGKWHTVKVRRDRKTGIMYVDGKGPVTETDRGRYSGLVLTDPLYLGGVPIYHDIPADIDIKSGFVGCISQLKVGHNYYDLLREATSKTGITTCETCQESPCQNQGVCQESLSREGFTCICTEGFSGPTCNKVASQSCTPYTCGVGRCVDNEYSYECHCPLGRVGNHCEHEVTIIEPAFTKNAYVAYPPLRTPRRLKINLKIKPRDVTDGILMYSAQDPEGHGNFVSLAVKDKRVEFRYDVGNGPVVIRSDRDLQPEEYVIISAMKSSTEGRLMVTGGNMVVERSLRSTQPLSLHTPLFLGGVNKGEISLSPGVGVTSGFNGCIAEFNVVGVDLRLIESATGSANVLDCASANSADSNLSNDINSDRNTQQYSHDNSRTGCSHNPCLNGGYCTPLSATDYTCKCRSGFTGRDCEVSTRTCELLRPCENGGTCEQTVDGYRCICPADFRGTNCETSQHIGNEAHFEGDGYLEFDRDLLPHNSEQEEVIALQFSTNASNGLVFWQGQRANEDGAHRDNIGLAVTDGYLLFTFNTGSGPVDILNDRIRVDDGKLHTVILKRRVNYGSIDVDNEYLVKGESVYRRGIDVRGNIYLGGAPNISLMTGRFSQGFVGCIHAFEVQDSHTIELGTKAISGINVKPCSSSHEEEIVN